MLMISSHSPTGAIFKGIILPRLAALRPTSAVPRCSVFCTTAPARGASVDPGSSSTGPSYPPWAATSPLSAERRRSLSRRRSPNNHPPISDSFWDSLSSSSKTAFAAAERILETHKLREPLIRDEASSNSVSKETQSQSQPDSHETTVDDHHPFPPAVYNLLRQRFFRLAVFQILRTGEYATDSRLVEDAAAYLERRGAGKLATRLRRSCSAHTNPPSSSASPASPPLPISKTSTVSLEPPKARIRLWSEPEGKERARRPPDHWRHLSTISLSLPPSPSHQLPPSMLSASQGSQHKMHLSPEEKAARQKALTAYYNQHLSRLLASPSSSHDPFGLETSSKGRALPSPSAGLAQLRLLVHRISTLEKHRGFVPDRITANILVKCWLRCGMALDASGNRMISHGRGSFYTRKSSSVTPIWREEDLKAMWSLMKRLMLLSPTLPRVFDPRAAPASAKSQESDTLEYGKHIRPFCGMIIRAARSVGAWELMDEVMAFQAEQRRLLSPNENERESVHSYS